MDSQIIDARGWACPKPVVSAKKMLEALTEGSVTMIVDDEAAKENLLALARSLGCTVDVEQKENEFYVQITKKGCSLTIEEQHTGNTVILITSSGLGRGSEELGAILMKSMMFTIVESEEPPGTVLFVNGGVYLTCEDSPVLEHLMNLEQRGVEILSCGTCLDYFKLKEKLAVGQVTNMYAILEKMNKSDKVITL